MRILHIRRGPYPARAYPVSTYGLASFRMQDLIVRGLAELGHEVFYDVKRVEEPLPEGVRWAANGFPPVNIAHRSGDPHTRISDHPQPWVRTCHTDLAARGMDRSIAEANWIFVSRSLARSYGGARYVVNGIDPSEFIYSESKDDYFLFIACLDRALEKGLNIAIALAARAGFKLVVAGSAARNDVIEDIQRMSAGADVQLAGEVQRSQRAELFAGARALLFPTQINEAFGIVMAEALISGTPVICSNRGACPEIISPEVGFVCATEQEYLSAIANIHTIKPSACRKRALRDYHYLRMAKDYVKEYEREIANPSKPSGLSVARA
jgi:glycosyltransferase involved in cell wall biosynthesis